MPTNSPKQKLRTHRNIVLDLHISTWVFHLFPKVNATHLAVYVATTSSPSHRLAPGSLSLWRVGNFLKFPWDERVDPWSFTGGSRYSPLSVFSGGAWVLDTKRGYENISNRKTVLQFCINSHTYILSIMSENDRYSMIYNVEKNTCRIPTRYKLLLILESLLLYPWNEFWILEIKTTVQQTSLFQKRLENFQKHNGWFACIFTTNN